MTIQKFCEIYFFEKLNDTSFDHLWGPSEPEVECEGSTSAGRLRPAILGYSNGQFDTLIFQFDLSYNINVYGPPQKRGFHLRHPVYLFRPKV